MLIAFAMVLVGCEDIGFGHNNNGHHGGDNLSQAYELQADGSWKGTVDGTILKGTNAAYIAELDKAPSAGGQPSNVKSISSNYEYTNTSGAAKMVIIRTTGGNLTINAPLDTVLHYGEAGTVNVIAVASSSYDGYAAITQKLVAKAGHIKLFDIIAAAIPLIEVPADATGAVAVDIPEDVVVEAVTVASAQATSIKIEGSVNTVTDTGAGTTTVEVKETGIVDKTDGVTATGDGYVADNNGGGEMGTSPDDFSSSPWKIYTPKGLAEVATRVNSGTTGDVQLQRSISISGSEWTPIGSKSADKPFTGTFDGNGMTISGLTISSGNDVGLFGYTSGATIKDLSLSGASITGNKDVAVVVGNAAGTLTMNGVTVDNLSTVSSTEKAAGIVGVTGGNTTVTMNSCVNAAAVSGDQRISGFISQSHLGDVIQFVNCQNNGTISLNKSGDYLTGKYGVAAGFISHSNNATISYNGCSNSGTINAPLAADYHTFVNSGIKYNGSNSWTCSDPNGGISLKNTIKMVGIKETASSKAYFNKIEAERGLTSAFDGMFYNTGTAYAVYFYGNHGYEYTDAQILASKITASDWNSRTYADSDEIEEDSTNPYSIVLQSDLTWTAVYDFGTCVDLTVDLNGHTLTANEGVISSPGGGTKIHFKNGTLNKAGGVSSIFNNFQQSNISYSNVTKNF